MSAAGVLTDRVIKMGNKRMWAEGKRFCRWLVLSNKRKIWGIRHMDTGGRYLYRSERLKI